ncbi:BLOC-1-related complex subunit 7 isoform X3 [Bufo bufo]|uniref:BLOC-1-related complex subunit 7 isoform X3 n=1 Tax=Bufo bufo TaxID=8384 RepID=UPI001ABE6B76|nr:BLOC-1-related complex subunit 7 isoform X3 [Bufo bufo]
MEREVVAKMAASTDGQTKYGQSVKGLLTEKVSTCGADVIALTKQVLKGSRSSELLGHAARNMVMQEDAILHSEDSLRKMAIITTHLQYQQEAIQKKDTISACCNGKKDIPLLFSALKIYSIHHATYTVVFSM